MFRAFSGKSADQTWLQVMESLRSDPNAPVQESRGGPTQEILHAAISIENSVDRWVISRHPAINPAYAFAELIWTINGRDDSAFLTYFNSKLPELAGDGPTFHGAYGKRLRRQFGFDQFERVYHALRENPDSRQVVLQIWNGEIDLPTNDGKPVAADIPCNIVSLLKVRRGRLEWTQVMRSNDIFRGIPYDLVQFTFLQEIIAGWLGITPGSYCHVSDSLHAYTKDLPQILAAVPVQPEPDTSRLTLPFEQSETAFRQLAAAVDQIVRPDSSVKQLLSTLHACELPPGYKDMLAVLTAEGLRIRNDETAYKEAIAACTNSLYRQLWARWLERYPFRKIAKANRDAEIVSA